MKKGYLSQYFNGIAGKTLSDVEADCIASNQHEFNGVKELRRILGEPEEKIEYQTKFIYLTDSDDDPIVDDGKMTWYDSRKKAREEKQVMRYEYRLYFSGNRVMQCANAGDTLIIARKPDNTLLAVVAEKNTTISSQIVWLFGLSDMSHPGFSVREELETEQDRIEFASRLILENIGIEIVTEENSFMDGIISRFGYGFPSTRDFSEYARSTLGESLQDYEPDNQLMILMEREEILFRILEKQIIGKRISDGFGTDVDAFLTYSLSVQNRRKSRVGHALENHLEFIFISNKIRYSRTPRTENNSKPDFIFPGIEEYRDPCFNNSCLTMLGVKSTCKDRWRQVLSEASRIRRKHLFTLEAAISTNQTDEMVSNDLQLVIPKKLHNSYTKKQQDKLIDLAAFIGHVREIQHKTDCVI